MTCLKGKSAWPSDLNFCHGFDPQNDSVLQASCISYLEFISATQEDFAGKLDTSGCKGIFVD
jgi:hypothetical protein